MSDQSLTPQFPRKASDMSPEMRALELQVFDVAWEFLLEHTSTGRSLESFCQEYHTPLVAARFRTWIYRDEKRRKAYYAAKAVGAEAIEEEMIRIADGLDPNGQPTINDVQRSTLQINTRKWLLGVYNRKRYGDTKHIEQTTTTRFDASALSTEELQQRLFRSLNLVDEEGDLIAD